jgi:hypothetical protein
MRDIVLLAAHCDDEVIFGWPVLQQVKRIICCSSDLNNPDRQWCKDRKKALQEVGVLVGAEVVCLDYDSEFYRLNTRQGGLWKMSQEVLKLLQSAECVYTHNPWGEYGNLDHILVHQIARMSQKNLIYSDMCIEAGWLPCTPWRSSLVPERSCVNDTSFYERCKGIYEKIGCWTWSKGPILRARIYEDN